MDLYMLKTLGRVSVKRRLATHLVQTFGARRVAYRPNLYAAFLAQQKLAKTAINQARCADLQ